MNRDDVLERLQACRPQLEEMGVRSIALFGSVARGEADADSDIDVLVDLRPGLGLFAFLRIKHHLEEVLGSPVDLVSVAGLRPRIRPAVEREMIRVA